MTDICLSTTCDDSQIPVSCPPPHCDTLQCICIPIVTVESELGRIAREEHARANERVANTTDKIKNSQHQFELEILEAKLLLKQFIAALPATSPWKKRYSILSSSTANIQRLLDLAYKENRVNDIADNIRNLQNALKTPARIREDRDTSSRGTLTTSEIQTLVESVGTIIPVSEQLSRFLKDARSDTVIPGSQKRKAKPAKKSIVKKTPEPQQITVATVEVTKTASDVGQIAENQPSEITISNPETRRVLIRYHRLYMMHKYAKLHKINLPEEDLYQNLLTDARFREYEKISKPFQYDPMANIDTRPYAILRRYFEEIGVNLRSLQGFSRLLDRVMDLTKYGDVAKFEEIPVEDFSAGSEDNLETIVQRQDWIKLYKKYWEDRITKVRDSNLAIEPAVKAAIENRYQIAKQVWLKSERQDVELDVFPEQYRPQDYAGNAFIMKENPTSTLSHDPDLILVPSALGKTQLDFNSEADDVKILRLVKRPVYNTKFKEYMESRLKKVIIAEAKANGTYPEKESDYEPWLRDQLKKQDRLGAAIEEIESQVKLRKQNKFVETTNISTESDVDDFKKSAVLDVLMRYYTNVKQQTPRTDDFAKKVQKDYKHMYQLTKTQYGSIPFMPASTFPSTETGDRLWKNYMKEFGYVAVEHNKDSRKRFEDNLKKLRQEAVETMKADEAVSENIMETVASMSNIKLIKYMAKHPEGLHLKTLEKDWVTRARNIIDSVIGDYDPSVVPPLTEKDFKESGQTLEQYNEYILRRMRKVTKYNESHKPKKSSDSYVKLNNMTEQIRDE